MSKVQSKAHATYGRCKRYAEAQRTAVGDLMQGDIVLVNVAGTLNQRAVLKDGENVVFVLPRSGKVAPKGPKGPKAKAYDVVGHVEGGWSGTAITPVPKAAKAPKPSKAKKANVSADLDMGEIVKALRASASVVSKAADVLERLA